MNYEEISDRFGGVLYVASRIRVQECLRQQISPILQLHPEPNWPSCAHACCIVACSAGVFFGRTNVLLSKAHVETPKEGRKWGESKGAGHLPLGLLVLLSLIFLRHNKDGGYNSTNINKQLSPAQTTPALQASWMARSAHGKVYSASLQCRRILGGRKLLVSRACLSRARLLKCSRFFSSAGPSL